MSECQQCSDERYCEDCSAAEWDAVRTAIMLDRRVSSPGIPPGMSYAEFYHACKNDPDSLGVNHD